MINKTSMTEGHQWLLTFLDKNKSQEEIEAHIANLLLKGRLWTADLIEAFASVVLEYKALKEKTAAYLRDIDELGHALLAANRLGNDYAERAAYYEEKARKLAASLETPAKLRRTYEA